MQRRMLKSKIHRATITDCDVDYVGSDLERYSPVVVHDENGVSAVDSDPTALLGELSREQEALL